MKNIEQLVTELAKMGYYKFEDIEKEKAIEIAISHGTLFSGMDWQRGRLFRVHRESFHVGKFGTEWKERIKQIAQTDIYRAELNSLNDNDFEIIVNDVVSILPKEFQSDFYSYFLQSLGTINKVLNNNGSRCEFYSIFTGEKDAFTILLTDEMSKLIFESCDVIEKFELPEKATITTNWNE